MNFIYEEYPEEITVGNIQIPIVTDFREIIRFIDMLKDDHINVYEKIQLIRQYFLMDAQKYDFTEAMDMFCEFIAMREEKIQNCEEKQTTSNASKALYSYEIDYPYIYSAFLQVYGINIRTIKYMHWWEFRMLFDGLPSDTEIKQRITYRGINLSEIKNQEERTRILKIQKMIRLPEAEVTDFEIGDVLW